MLAFHDAKALLRHGSAGSVALEGGGIDSPPWVGVRGILLTPGGLGRAEAEVEQQPGERLRVLDLVQPLR